MVRSCDNVMIWSAVYQLSVTGSRCQSYLTQPTSLSPSQSPRVGCGGAGRLGPCPEHGHMGPCAGGSGTAEADAHDNQPIRGQGGRVGGGGGQDERVLNMWVGCMGMCDGGEGWWWEE